jgi:hypothetical protein
MPHSENAFGNAMAQASNNAQARGIEASNAQQPPVASNAEDANRFSRGKQFTPNLQHTQGFVSVVTAEKPDPFPYRLLNVVLYGALAWEVLSIATKVYALVL